MKNRILLTQPHELIPALVGLALAAGAANSAAALSLTNIPPVGTDVSNEGRCITPDGRYVGGLSSTNKGFFYDVANNYVVQPPTGTPAGKAVSGIAHRTDTNQNPPQLQIIVDTESVGWHAFYMTADAGLNWRRVLPHGSTLAYKDFPSPAANSLAATPAGDVFYSIFRNSGKTAVYVCRGSNLWDNTTSPQFYTLNKSVSGDRLDALGVAATGRIVGYRETSGVRKNTLYDYPASSGTQWQFNGLAGTLEGEAWSVSQDGTCIFGRSPVTPGASTLYGYKTVVTAAPPNSQLSIHPLPLFSDSAGSTSLAVPYGCTADGQYAVGMNYRGRETAVLWDTGNADPALWTVTDLRALAAANGVADIFTRLTRAYSVGTNGAGDPVITGVGTDGSNTRAFLMTVPRWVAAIGFPGPQTVDFGATVTFRLVTNGVDALAYQWYRNGAPLTDGGNVAGATTASLTVSSVTCPAGDAGDYQVVVSNAVLSAVVTGSVAVLTIRDPYISAQPASQTNSAGSTVTFTVTASGSSPLSYQWKRDGLDLADGPTGFGSIISGATNATLTISNVTGSDSGAYTVLVSGEAGCQTTSVAASLTVLVPPALSISGNPLTGLTLTWPTMPNWTYELQYATDLEAPNWMTIFYWWPNSGDPATVMDYPPPTDPQRFYRVLMYQ